jgi:hypothetical protein
MPKTRSASETAPGGGHASHEDVTLRLLVALLGSQIGYGTLLYRDR